MWRTTIAHSTEHLDTPSGHRYAEQDRRLAEQVTDLIAVLQDRGQVHRELIATDLGALIFGALIHAFIEFIKHDDMTIAQLRTEIAAQIKSVASLVSGRAPTNDN